MWPWLRRCAWVCSLVTVLGALPRLAMAHHVPGHGASEGVRNLSTLGVGAAAVQTRVMLLEEITTSTTGLNPGTTSMTSLLGEVTVHPWVSLGLVAPLLVVKQGDAPARVGYGDTRLMLRVTPHADKLIHRVFTAGINASFPTRSVRFAADPGRLWTLSPYVLFTRTYRIPFWQVAGTATMEHRPAGTAFDVHGSFQVGLRTQIGFMATVGIVADLRVLNVCTQPRGGAEVCLGNRATEIEREVGSLRLAQTYGVAWRLPRAVLISAYVAAPVTARRDFDVLGSLGVQVAF